MRAQRKMATGLWGNNDGQRTGLMSYYMPQRNGCFALASSMDARHGWRVQETLHCFSAMSTKTPASAMLMPSHDTGAAEHSWCHHTSGLPKILPIIIVVQHAAARCMLRASRVGKDGLQIEGETQDTIRNVNEKPPVYWQSITCLFAISVERARPWCIW